MEHVDKITRGEPPAEPRPHDHRQGGRRCRVTIHRGQLFALASPSRLATAGAPRQDATDGPGPNLVIEVAGATNGTIVIDLLPDVAPQHVAQIIALATRRRL